MPTATCDTKNTPVSATTVPRPTTWAFWCCVEKDRHADHYEVVSVDLDGSAM
jgi:hypothetical protein